MSQTAATFTLCLVKFDFTGEFLSEHSPSAEVSPSNKFGASGNS